MVVCVVAATILRGATGVPGTTGRTGATGRRGYSGMTFIGATGEIGPMVRSIIKTPSSTDLAYRETCLLLSKCV